MLGLARSLQAGSRHLTVAIRSAVHVAARSPVPVSQFGLLRVRSSLPVTITALDARSFPDSALASDVSQALFQLRAADTDDGRLAATGWLDALEVTPCDDGGLDVVLHGDAGAAPAAAELHVHIPFSCPVDVTTTDAVTRSTPSHVVLQKLEGGAIAVKTGRGDCRIEGVKAPSMNIATNSGNLEAKSLQGDLIFTSEQGSVRVGKLQAITSDLRTRGDICIESLYSTTSHVQSDEGDVIIGDAHGVVNVSALAGLVYIGSMDGDVLAAQADEDVVAHLVQVAQASLVSNHGDISLTLDTTLDASIRIIGRGTIFGTKHIHGAAPDGIYVDGEPADNSQPAIYASADEGTVVVNRANYMESSMAKATYLKAWRAKASSH